MKREQKNEKKLKSRWKKIAIISSIMFVFFLFMLLVTFGYYQTEYQKKPVVKEKIQNKDYNYLYEFYVSGEPHYTGRPYLGSENASIEFVAYLDISSPASKYFINNILPQIKKDYIDTGKLKFFHKNYITSEDYIAKNDRYIYTQALLCMNTLNPKEYYSYYFELFNASPSNIVDFAVKHGVDRTNFSSCINKKIYEEIKEDMSEVENFGMIGINPWFYISLRGVDKVSLAGNPPYKTFKKLIRNYQLQIGD